MESHVININLPKLVEEARGRRKKNRFATPFLAALAVKGIIMSMTYKSIAVVAGTALIIGKTQFLTPSWHTCKRRDTLMCVWSRSRQNGTCSRRHPRPEEAGQRRKGENHRRDRQASDAFLKPHTFELLWGRWRSLSPIHTQWWRDDDIGQHKPRLLLELI